MKLQITVDVTIQIAKVNTKIKSKNGQTEQNIFLKIFVFGNGSHHLTQK